MTFACPVWRCAACSVVSGSWYRTKCRDSARSVLRPPARCPLQSNPSNGCGICLGKDDRQQSETPLAHPLHCGCHDKSEQRHGTAPCSRVVLSRRVCDCRHIALITSTPRPVFLGVRWAAERLLAVSNSVRTFISFRPDNLRRSICPCRNSLRASRPPGRQE